MEPPLGVFRPETTIAEATSALRLLSKRAFITFLFVVDEQERLLGLVVMREMLLSENPSQRLQEIMIRSPFHLTPEMSLIDAMCDAPALSARPRRRQYKTRGPECKLLD